MKTYKAISEEAMKRELNYLLYGYSYKEVAEFTGIEKQGIIQRNFSIYKVDMVDAFRKRIQHEGIPNQLNITDNFGYWFSGFFDGEGCLLGATLKTEHIVRIMISLRRDDLAILNKIKKILDCGIITNTTDNPNNQGYQSSPKSIYVVQTPKELCEIVIPLFDKYPLQTKKGKEYPIWRELAMERYIHSMGGKSHLHWSKEKHQWWLEKVKLIRDLKLHQKGGE